MYKAAGDKKVQETFIDQHGVENPKYREVTAADLKRQHKHLLSMAREGVDKGFISEEDGTNMVPREPKNHKPVEPETGVPPWRKIVSGAGSQTEGASKVVNFFLNPINMKVHSYLEDSRDMLLKVKEINQTLAPLPPQTRMVTPDVTAMYPSIPPDLGVAAAERALLGTGMEAGLVDWVQASFKEDNFSFMVYSFCLQFLYSKIHVSVLSNVPKFSRI